MKKILKLFVLAVMLAVPAMASAVDQLPKGFIAVSESRMNWADAKAFCQQHGGRLPRINKSDSWDGNNPPLRGILIDGFGYAGHPWAEIGLPGEVDFWAGTEHSTGTGEAWGVGGVGGRVVVFDIQNGDRRVVCVPK